MLEGRKRPTDRSISYRCVKFIIVERGRSLLISQGDTVLS